MSKTITLMSAPEDWDNREKMLDMLAARLVKRRISLFLGAGASFAFKLPSWTQLVDNLYELNKIERPPEKNDTADSESLFVSKYNGDRISFAKDVQIALYKDYYHEQSKIESNPLLSAIGALVMSSARGRVAHVITLNYDDLLECYLKRRGFTVSSVPRLPNWISDADVEVLHPHGLLSTDLTQKPSRGVVLTELDYDEIVGNIADLWRQRIIDILRSTTCVFVGLSGKDQNLRNILSEVKKNHSSTLKEPYWGVRIGCDDNNSTWTTRGVYAFNMENHDEAPELIMEICRRAADMRSNSF